MTTLYYWNQKLNMLHQAIEETMRQVNDDLNTTRTALEASRIVDQGKWDHVDQG